MEAWSLSLTSSVWDQASLSSSRFELVNGAYGDEYRAKALMNLPDGRCFGRNWIQSQSGSPQPHGVRLTPAFHGARGSPLLRKLLGTSNAPG